MRTHSWISSRCVGTHCKAALLTITSDAARSSPVKRGKWFLETFLGLSPPDPPPGVNTTL